MEKEHGPPQAPVPPRPQGSLGTLPTVTADEGLFARGAPLAPFGPHMRPCVTVSNPWLEGHKLLDCLCLPPQFGLTPETRQDQLPSKEVCRGTSAGALAWDYQRNGGGGGRANVTTHAVRRLLSKDSGGIACREPHGELRSAL